MLKYQPVLERKAPLKYVTWVAQIDVRHRTVCEYGSQVVNHLRPFTSWYPGVEYRSVCPDVGFIVGVTDGVTVGVAVGVGDGEGEGVGAGDGEGVGDGVGAVATVTSADAGEPFPPSLSVAVTETVWGPAAM